MANDVKLEIFWNKETNLWYRHSKNRYEGFLVLSNFAWFPYFSKIFAGLLVEEIWEQMSWFQVVQKYKLGTTFKQGSPGYGFWF